METRDTRVPVMGRRPNGELDEGLGDTMGEMGAECEKRLQEIQTMVVALYDRISGPQPQKPDAIVGLAAQGLRGIINRVRCGLIDLQAMVEEIKKVVG